MSLSCSSVQQSGAIQHLAQCEKARDIKPVETLPRLSWHSSQKAGESVHTQRKPADLLLTMHNQQAPTRFQRRGKNLSLVKKDSINLARLSLCRINGYKEVSDALYEIQLRDVSREYGKRTVVDGVNLSIKQGEVVGLLGPNGAGKSTTFNITVGRERPSQGCVLLNGRDITALPLDARARLGVGYLTQEPSVFRGLSVRDNLLLVLQETGVPRAEQGQRIEGLLTEFRLTHVQHTKGGALSGGERRRTELARALASNCAGGPPKILLVDEPFAGVDPIGVAEIQALLRKLCDELHMGILITDHNVTETLKICDRAYMVFQGQLMAQGSPQELVQNPFVRQYYLGEGYKRPDLQQDTADIHTPKQSMPSQGDQGVS